jgi:hypothetical protein
MSCVVESLDYFSVDVWLHRVTGIQLQKMPCYSLKCRYLMSRLVFCVLFVARFIGPFFSPWNYNTPICNTFPVMKHCVSYNWNTPSSAVFQLLVMQKNVTGCFRIEKKPMFFFFVSNSVLILTPQAVLPIVWLQASGTVWMKRLWPGPVYCAEQ